MSYLYNLYSMDEGHFGIGQSYNIQCDLPLHKFRSIMMEFRRNDELGNDIEGFVKYMQETFPNSFKLFHFDDTVQFDADQENSTILANLLDEVDQTV
ncbi:hypothetical protein [Metabacillus fastidiosus]|uniref:hypothetical protein n=1 Tax=Metabacillus fastidiosus TaxID=1458 RepID=UPI002DB75687|nr:hypothetical protein [Metabacillus fastidiosus]MEC2076667.1 hypothetical protein [Metabacillus fastidiosus]